MISARHAFRPACLLMLAIALAMLESRAHTPATTSFDFVKDVLPIIERRCTPCHAATPSAPMSLVDYDSLRPWNVSIKEQLLAETMPPWPVERSAWPLALDRRLSAVELDTLVDWVSGGAPRPPEAPRARFGTPLAPAAIRDAATISVALGALRVPPIDTARGTVTVTWSEAPASIGSWTVETRVAESLRAVRLAIDSRDGLTSVDLGSWTLGEEWIEFPAGVAAVVRPGDRIRAAWIYAKPWHREKDELEDEPVVRFATLATARGVLRSVSSSTGVVVLPHGARVLALRPEGEARGAVRIESAAPGGELTRAVELTRIDPAWPITLFVSEPVPSARIAWERDSLDELVVLYSSP